MRPLYFGPEEPEIEERRDYGFLRRVYNSLRGVRLPPIRPRPRPLPIIKPSPEPTPEPKGLEATVPKGVIMDPDFTGEEIPEIPVYDPDKDKEKQPVKNYR